MKGACKERDAGACMSACTHQSIIREVRCCDNALVAGDEPAKRAREK